MVLKHVMNVSQFEASFPLQTTIRLSFCHW